MVTMFQKINKSKKNLFGFQELRIEDKPLLKPTMICLSAQARHAKSVYGIVREGMRAARLRTTQDRAAKYDLANFPVQFVGLSYDYQDKSFEDSIAQDYFLPILSNYGSKLPLEQAKNNMRNITFMTYCDGIHVYKDFEVSLVKELQKLGYTNDEIKEIFKELSLIAVETMQDTSTCLATSFQLVDTQDTEIWEIGTKTLIDGLEKQNTNHDFIRTGIHNGIYYYNGNGNHSIKAFFENGNLANSVISIIVSQSLTRSIDKSTEFSFELIQKVINSMIKHYNLGYSSQAILNDIDSCINYPGARILSDFECDNLDIIDELSRKANTLENDNRVTKSQLANEKLQNSKLMKAINDNLSEIDRLTILRAIGWQLHEEDLEKLVQAKKQ